MGNLSQEIIVVTGIAISLIVVAVGVVSLFLIYRNKQLQSNQEKEKMQSLFSQQLLQSKLEMQEQTFNTISTEIHDNVGQILSLAKVQLNILDQSGSLDRNLLADAKESVGKAMTDLRDIAKSLNSERIRLYDLREITDYELQRLGRAGSMSVDLKTDGQVINQTEQKKLITFRMIQECLQNIIKHSRATHIEVCFQYAPEQLKISITDNGRGFDQSLVTEKDGLGLQNIVSRAALIGGKAVIESTPGTGTLITITSPYE